MKKRVEVVCAIIVIEGKILALQRSKEMNLPLKWEFPGGKIEPNETEEECIKREILEELNIEISLGEKLKPSLYDYPNISIELIPFMATHKRGEIKLREHKKFALLTKEELSSLDWAEADLPIVKELQEL